MNRKYLTEFGLRTLIEQLRGDPSGDEPPAGMDMRLGQPPVGGPGDPSKQGRVTYGDALYVGKRGKTFKPSRPGQSPRGGEAEYRMSKYDALVGVTPSPRPTSGIPAHRNMNKGNFFSRLFSKR